MYSPKIRDYLVPKLYKIARAKKVPMTRLVSKIIADAISKIEVIETVIMEPTSEFMTVYTLVEKQQVNALPTTKENHGRKENAGVWPRQGAQGAG